jgi:DNA-binding beta-propeller fold protein YncE
MFVSERGNFRIQKFRLANPCPAGTTQIIPGVCFVTKWGSRGSANGEFKFPNGIAIDSSGNVYVADTGNQRIQKFGPGGNFIRAWGSFGTGNGQFDSPWGIAVDSSSNVYVTDNADFSRPVNHRIQKFRSDGSFIRAWGSFGTGNGQFNCPSGIAIDSSANVYVADRNNNRIQKFTNEGNFIRTWGTPGTGNGQFTQPIGVALDSSANVFVSDSPPLRHRIQKFTNEGTFTTAWGSRGSADGQFDFPVGLAIKSADVSFLEERVYVSDGGNNRIQVFRPELIVHPT